MGNQYSITVSTEANGILERLKKRGYMPSRIIDAAIVTLYEQALENMHQAQDKKRKWHAGEVRGY